MSEKVGYRNLIDDSKENVLDKFKERDEYFKYLYTRALALGENIELPAISLTESGFRLDKITPMLIEGDILYIPEGITIIAHDASYSLNLKEIEKVKKIIFNDELISIGADSFYDYKNLELIEFNNGLREISSDAFFNTAIKVLNIPGTVKYVYSNICNKASIEEFILNYGSLKFILKSYYSYGQIKTLWIPPTIAPLNLRPLCNLLEIHIFNENDLSKFCLPKGVKIIVEKDGWGNWKDIKKQEIEKQLNKLYKKLERYEKMDDDTMLNKTNKRINSLKSSLNEL